MAQALLLKIQKSGSITPLTFILTHFITKKLFSEINSVAKRVPPRRNSVDAFLATLFIAVSKFLVEIRL